MWVRGSLTLPSIRNESVCFQLNIFPTADETGTGLHIPDSWQLGKLYCVPCPVISPLPGGLLPTPKHWGQPANLHEIPAGGQRCLPHPTPCPFPSSRLPYSQPTDLISTTHSEDKHLSRGTAHAAAQRHDNSVASLEKGT